jgi:hypothetical protein
MGMEKIIEFINGKISKNERFYLDDFKNFNDSDIRDAYSKVVDDWWEVYKDYDVEYYIELLDIMKSDRLENDYSHVTYNIPLMYDGDDKYFPVYLILWLKGEIDIKELFRFYDSDFNEGVCNFLSKVTESKYDLFTNSSYTTYMVVKINENGDDDIYLKKDIDEYEEYDEDILFYDITKNDAILLLKYFQKIDMEFS